VQQRIAGIENSIKVRRNQLKALHNDTMVARKEQQERELRAAVAADPELQASYGNAWGLIDDAIDTYRNFYEEHLFIESAAAFYSTPAPSCAAQQSASFQIAKECARIRMPLCRR
jgi:hypothetical protein